MVSDCRMNVIVEIYRKRRKMKQAPWLLHTMAGGSSRLPVMASGSCSGGHPLVIKYRGDTKVLDDV
jgi:hypothetical protein